MWSTLLLLLLLSPVDVAVLLMLLPHSMVQCRVWSTLLPGWMCVKVSREGWGSRCLRSCNAMERWVCKPLCASDGLWV